MTDAGLPILHLMSEFDVVVVGGGAAGLSAALVLSRARRRVAVVDAGHPRNAPAAHMHGFLSRDGLPPGELLAMGREEVRGYGGHIIHSTVTEAVRGTSSDFELRLSNGSVRLARRLLVATGLRDVLPDIPGLRERFGRDVLHCPYCHGYEVRDRPLAVLGATADDVEYAQLVRQWSADVVLFPHTGALTAEQRQQLAARAIDVADGPVARLVVEDDRLSGLQLHHGRVVPRTAVFIRPRFIPNDELLVALGAARDHRGWVVADAVGRTTVEGVWVAGNAANPRAQVITAAGEGSAAAIALNADLVEEDVANAVERAHVNPTRTSS
jgi:thioredoxin reductase